VRGGFHQSPQPTPQPHHTTDGKRYAAREAQRQATANPPRKPPHAYKHIARSIYSNLFNFPGGSEKRHLEGTANYRQDITNIGTRIAHCKPPDESRRTTKSVKYVQCTLWVKNGAPR